jgi:hypothetical protein
MIPIKSEEDLRELGKQLLNGFIYSTNCPHHNERRYVKSLTFDGDGIHIEWFCLACYHEGVYNTKTTVPYLHVPSKEPEPEPEQPGDGGSD